MRTLTTYRMLRASWLLAVAALFAGPPAWSQVPVDAEGNPLDAEVVGDAPGDATAAAGEATAPAETLSAKELDELVGRIALYPDDLLAVVLPASAYPLQIVEAARFLDALEDNPDLKPDESWDDSVVALLNYPEVVRMMNEDLDWTYALGEAVVAQQADVIDAIERFRDRAYAAGNLKSDDRQTVTRDDNGVIEIAPASEETIYVPYYEPKRVVVYQPTPVYHYYPRPCPVYYYPYPFGYSFASGYFWGVTTAFQISWLTHHVHVLHHSYWGHPYFGHSYFTDRWWYRRPSIHVHNTFYVNNNRHRPAHHERDGDLWRPRRHSGAALDRRGFREAYYTDRRQRSDTGYTRGFDASRARGDALRGDVASRLAGSRDRDRSTRLTPDRADASSRRASDAAIPDRRDRADVARRAGDDTIRFRSRDGSAGDTAIRFRSRDGNAGNDAIRFRSRDGSAGDTAIRFRSRDGNAADTALRPRPRAGSTSESRATDRNTVERPVTPRAVPGPTLRERPALQRDAEPARRAASPRALERSSPSSRSPSGMSRAAPSVSRPAPSVSRPSPSVSRPAPSAAPPAPSVSRPSSSVSRPSPSVSRPSPSVSRPSPSASRPSSHMSRPSASSSRASPAPRSRAASPSTRRQNRD